MSCLTDFFCQVKKANPCSKRPILSWMEYQEKLNEKYTLVLHCISSFEGTSYKNLQDNIVVFPVIFISCCFISTFTSGDVVFYNF